MKIYVLHECEDSNDFYAESSISFVTKNLDEAKSKMIKLYTESLACFDKDEISEDETWCENLEASVVTNSSSYYRHNWKIEEFEV